MKNRGMKIHDIKECILRIPASIRLFYLTGLLLALGLKWFYSRAGSPELDWILSPTAGWVSFLCGIPFEKHPQAGYVNDCYRFIIAPSCSGVQFMVVTMSTLLFSYLNRMKTGWQGLLWTLGSVGTAYVYTIFINGVRIALSIFLPLWLPVPEAGSGWLTPQRLHTMLGTAIYFTALLVIYQAAGYWVRNSQCKSAGLLHSCIPPLCWYLIIVLGIPFLNGARQKEGADFVEYAKILTAVCCMVLSLCVTARIIIGYGRRRARHTGL